MSAFPALTVAAGASLVTSCDDGLGVYDDLDACPRGVVMRFIFDYNLEFANSFHRQVDCLAVYLFDEEGKLVEYRPETTPALTDENWRMTFDLPAGNYQAVAYGGTLCELSSFHLTNDVASIATIDDLELMINSDRIGEESARPGRPLHDLYHGYLKFTVNEGTTYDKAIMEMIRDTNHIRVVLQHIDNTPVDDKDFHISIVDDNVRYDYRNNVLPYATVTYTPWVTGTATTGLDGLPGDDNAAGGSRAPADPVQVAYAELSTARLMYRSNFTWTDSSLKSQQGPRLRILSKEGRIVADLPLNNYLLLLKSDYFNKMGSQEFLDRCSRYNLVFFLDHDNVWVQMNIIVDDWTVRINNIEY